MIAVIFQENFTVERACKMPLLTVKQLGHYKKHINGHLLILRDKVWDEPEVVDVTEPIRFCQAEMEKAKPN